MKIGPILLSVAVAVSACATPRGPVTASDRPSTHCLLIATIAREQYDYDADMILPLDRGAYVPRCDWKALGLDVELVDYDSLEPLSPIISFRVPRRSGGYRVVRVLHYNGVHAYDRTCRLELKAGEWRLVEECPITWSF